jgi:hypothetical protein
MIFNISCNTKLSILAVNGCRDRILIWVIRFRYIHKSPDVICVPNINTNHNMYCVKFAKSLYDLKQSGRMWYNRLKKFLLNKGYSNNDDCSCVFIKKSTTKFCIISVYVDDLNITAHTKDID